MTTHGCPDAEAHSTLIPPSFNSMGFIPRVSAYTRDKNDCDDDNVCCHVCEFVHAAAHAGRSLRWPLRVE